LKKTPLIILSTCIVLLLLLAVLPFYGKFTSFEFTNRNLEHIYDCFRLYVLPLVILRILLISYKNKNTQKAKTATFLIKIFGSIYFIFILFAGLLNGMCTWSEDSVLFINNKDNASKIVLRGYGCGAWDSESPRYRVFKVRQVTPYLKTICTIDTAKMDRKLWTRIAQNK
jgi:hypothetical protein